MTHTSTLSKQMQLSSGICASSSTEYTSWKGMKRRCYNKNTKYYVNYGGRGIKVCDRWLGKDGFARFYADMGEKPSPEYSLDRIDNNGNYEPSNCRWTDRRTQNINRRINKNNTSGVVGVYKSYKGLWEARLYKDYKYIQLGYFVKKTDAILARKNAEAKYNSVGASAC